jgi:ABC-type glycerol-3-phosphate transport system permease component
MVRYKRSIILILDIIILFLLLLFLVPILHTIFTSVKDDAEIYKTPVRLLPAEVTSIHYNRVVTRLGKFFFSFFKNSVVVTSVSVILIIGLSSLASFGLARIDFIGRKFVIFFVAFVVSIPLIITVIPIFMLETFLKVKNTNLGLILPYTAVYMPIPIFILYATFLKIPSELEESARVDGCTRFTIFSRIFFPLASGGLVSAAIITFLSCWGEFLFALILTTKPKTTTLPIGIMMIKYEEQAWELGPLSAIIILSIIVPMTLYFVLQRYFIRGLLEGAVKG